MKTPRTLLLTSGLALTWLVLGVAAGRNSAANADGIDGTDAINAIGGRPAAATGEIAIAGPRIEAFGMTLQGPDRTAVLPSAAATAPAETNRPAEPAAGSSPDRAPGWGAAAAGFCARVAMVLLKVMLKLLIGWLPIEGI